MTARQEIGHVAVPVVVAGFLAAAVLAACFLAPTESSMGHAQRIVYVHVPVAWLGLLGFLVMAGSGVAYLARRDLRWDHWFQAAGELGWLCTGLTLVTGSLWAHEAWGTWWEWDPRLTTAFILWAIYSGILMVRSGLEDPHRRARVGAVLAVLGGLDVPLVVMATRWFRGLHPVAPEMDAADAAHAADQRRGLDGFLRVAGRPAPRPVGFGKLGRGTAAADRILRV